MSPFLACAAASRFDGVDDHAVLPAFSLDGDLTVEVEARREAGGAPKQNLVARRAPGRRDAFLFRIREDLGGVLEFGLGDGHLEWGMHGTTQVPAGEWARLTATYAHATGHVVLFVDGRLDAHGWSPVQGATGDIATWIAGDPALGVKARPYRGELRAVRVWARALAEAEVAGTAGNPLLELRGTALEALVVR